VILGIVGASLQSLGVVLVYRRARKEEREWNRKVEARGNPEILESDIAEWYLLVIKPENRVKDAGRDLLLVFTGFIFTAVAVVISAWPD
jgi:hypothetical protein